MTVVSLLTPADVVALKCVYFQLVKSLKEIDWYGLNCDTEQYIQDIELSFSYLEAINSGCTLTHPFECEVKTFITKKSSFCVFTSDKCVSTYTVEQLNDLFLDTENNNSLLTESLNNIIT